MDERDAFIQSARASILPDNSYPPMKTGFQKKQLESEHSTTLHRSCFTLLLVLFYVLITAFTWIAICVLSYKPLGAPSGYGVIIKNGYGYEHSQKYHDAMARNETWYRVAQVLQLVVGILDILVTSAAWASGAIVYTQRFVVSSFLLSQGRSDANSSNTAKSPATA